jgi:hypothetical protein
MRINIKKNLTGDITYSYLGEAMLTAPVILKNIVQDRYSQLVPILNQFMQMGLSEEETEINGHAVRWPVFGSTYPPTVIVSVSNATPTAGVPFEIEVRNGWFRNGAVLRLPVIGHNIQLLGDGRKGARGAFYTAQYISNDPGAVCPAGLLVAGNRVSFNAGVYPEGSDKGHPIRFTTADMYTNVSTIVRTSVGITGTAMVAPGVEYLTYQDEGTDPLTGEPYNFNGALPLYYKNGQPVLAAHLIAVEKQLLYGTGNFNPLTGTVVNTDLNNDVVQMGDGFYSQLDGLAKTMTFSLREPTALLAAKLEAIMMYVGMYTGQETVEIVMIGGKLAKVKLAEVIRYINKSSGVVTQQVLGDDRTISGGVATDRFVTDWGTIKWVWNRHADSEDSPSPRISVKGTAFPLESGNMEFIFKNPVGQKSNIRIYSVGGTFQGQKISRGLVYNTIPGMTGLGNSMVAGMEAAMAKTAGMVGSGRDGQQDEVLSEKMLIVDNPAQFGRLIATA